MDNTKVTGNTSEYNFNICTVDLKYLLFGKSD